MVNKQHMWIWLWGLGFNHENTGRIFLLEGCEVCFEIGVPHEKWHITWMRSESPFASPHVAMALSWHPTLLETHKHARASKYFK